MRKPRPEAERIILDALQCEPEGFCDATLSMLLKATGLPFRTLFDNLSRLESSGRVAIYHNDDSVIWVRLPE